jgi:hypothetical protein
MIAAWIPEDKGSATYFQVVHMPRRIPLGLLVDQCPNLVPNSQQADCAMKIGLVQLIICTKRNHFGFSFISFSKKVRHQL